MGPELLSIDCFSSVTVNLEEIAVSVQEHPILFDSFHERVKGAISVSLRSQHCFHFFLPPTSSQFIPVHLKIPSHESIPVKKPFQETFMKYRSQSWIREQLTLGLFIRLFQSPARRL